LASAAQPRARQHRLQPVPAGAVPRPLLGSACVAGSCAALGPGSPGWTWACCCWGARRRGRGRWRAGRAAGWPARWDYCRDRL